MSQSGKHDANETTRAVALVEEFLQAVVATPEGFWSSFDKYFDDTTVWENVGLGRTVGPAEAVSFARAFPFKFDHMLIEDLVLSGAGNRVFAERLDHSARVTARSCSRSACLAYSRSRVERSSTIATISTPPASLPP